MQVVKNRFSGDLGLMPLFFNRGTLTFSKRIFQRERTTQRKKRESAPRIDQLTSPATEEDAPPREVLLAPSEDEAGGGRRP